MNKREIRDFDRKLKMMAAKEPVAVPEGFARRMMRTAEDLPDEPARKSFRPKKALTRVLAVAALLLGLAGVTAFAAPYALKMAGGVIDYFNAPHQFKNLSKQVVYEQYNSKVGMSVADQGITLTVDNIAIDDNYLLVFYTLSKDTPIRLLGDEQDPEQWRVNWTAPHFWFKENGRYLESPAQGEVEAYLEDDYTLKGMQRFAIMANLKDKLNLEIYTEEIFGQKGAWHLALSVDKSAVAAETLTANPNLKARVTAGWNREYVHNITIEKVSISPFGSQIVISERGKKPFYQFALRDENGRYLTVIPAATAGGNRLFSSVNSFEFTGGSTAMRELTLIPIVSAVDSDNLPPPRLQTVPTGDYPVRMPVNELGGFILESLELTTEKAVAVFRQEGAVMVMTPSLLLLDENDKSLPFDAYAEEDYNRETGEITVTHLFRNGSPEDLVRVKKLGYITRTQRLNEDEAVTIKLK